MTVAIINQYIMIIHIIHERQYALLIKLHSNKGNDKSNNAIFTHTSNYNGPILNNKENNNNRMI